MAKSMSITLEFVAPLPQIAITRFTYNAVEFYGPQGPRNKEVDLYFGESLILRKMQGENANKIHYVYNAMVVLHICNRI